MPFKWTIRVTNPSTYERSDYVEVDLESLGVDHRLDEKSLRLLRCWPGGHAEEAPFQIDYPFGPDVAYRILTLFCPSTPPGDADYKEPSAEFSLEEGTHRDFAEINKELLKIEHFAVPGIGEQFWDRTKRIIGVKLCNGSAPSQQQEVQYDGLQVYFVTVPRPEFGAPMNYSGAAASILHHRSWRGTGVAEFLVPVLFRPHSPEKRWGQLTHIDVPALPWERRSYQTESLLGQPGSEPEYSLVWSHAGPLRATVTLKSHAIRVKYDGTPYFTPHERELTCHLYRVISLYPKKESYNEQLILRPEGEAGVGKQRISLAFRAHYYSYVDYPEQFPPAVATFERIPNYFALWRSFAALHHGYAFASDSYVRRLQVVSSEIRWRLDFGHEHRCIHQFLFHGPFEGELNLLHEIGQGAWYEQLYKPLQAIPLNRYTSP